MLYKTKLSPDWGKTHINFSCHYTDFKLCYVSNNLAYFTSQPLDKQWGDDWNDAPYEHNAGEPCEWHSNKGEPYAILILPFYAPYLMTPSEYGGYNSPYCVQSINNGITPWLTNEKGKVKIMAGTNPIAFASLVDLCAKPWMEQ